MECFPILRERVPFSGAVKVSLVEDIHCDCRMPYDNSMDMIQCASCLTWFHSICVSISDVEDYVEKNWRCVKCNEELD